VSGGRNLARSGPAFDQLQRQGPIDWEAWGTAAVQLERALAGAPDLDRRIHHLYLPVLFFAAARLHAASARPLVVGLQAPQGSGKTTLTRHVLSCLPALGLRGASVSIDDFYLTRGEQLALAAANPGNPYLEHRGYPGTHDVTLGERTLAALRALGPDAAGRQVRVPAYDKSAHGGRGDRAPEPEWPVVTGPLDIVFVEGWMLGFSPVPHLGSGLVLPHRSPDVAIQDLTPLAAPNRALAAYDRWHQLIDAWVVLRALDPSFVVAWRVDAEEAARRAGRATLDRAAIDDYVRRFLPAYRLYGGTLPRAEPARVLTLGLDAGRRPVPYPETTGRG
jgi:D-glycerate 3-kinase